ncbi:MAG: hypothetical protein R3C11_27990 [Planctomycetaceae bacterium]
MAYYRESTKPTVVRSPAFAERGIEPETPPIDVKAVQDEAWTRIQPHFTEVNQQTRELTTTLVSQIETFLKNAPKGAPKFAEDALSWKSKWELIKSRPGHRKFIAEKFSQYLFSQQELAQLLEQVSTEYAQGLKSVENQFLVKVRADLEDLPVQALPAFASQDVLEDRFANVVSLVTTDVASDLQFDIGREVTSLVSGEVIAVVITRTLTAVATRMGISGAILGTGAVSSTMTFGAGIVIGIAVDYILNWIISWFHDPVGNLSEKVKSSLAEVSDAIINGDPTTRKEYKVVSEMSESEADSELREAAFKAKGAIERSGALGLNYVLRNVTEIQEQSRQLALKQLVYDEVTLNTEQP